MDSDLAAFGGCERAQAEHDVFQDAQMGEKREILKNHPDLTQVGGDEDVGCTDDLAVKTDSSMLQRFKATNGSENGGFATTRGAEQTRNAASG